MKKIMSIFLFFLPAFSLAASLPHSLPPDAKQLIVVSTPNWNTITGHLQRFERQSSNVTWQAIGEAHFRL